MKKLLLLLTVGALTLLAAVAWQRHGQDPLQRAASAYQRGDYDEAVTIYDQALSTDAHAEHVRFNRAAAKYEAEAFQQAREDYTVTSGSAESLRAARSLYDAGNCFVRQAMEAQDEQRQAWLHEAIDHYDACMEEGRIPDWLQQDAEHNRQLALKLLKETISASAQAKASEAGKEEECEH